MEWMWSMERALGSCEGMDSGLLLLFGLGFVLQMTDAVMVFGG